MKNQNDAKDLADRAAMLAHDLLSDLRQRLNTLNQQQLYKGSNADPQEWYKYQILANKVFYSKVGKITNESLENIKTGLKWYSKSLGLTKEQTNQLLDQVTEASKGLQTGVINQRQRMIGTVMAHKTLAERFQLDDGEQRKLQLKRAAPVYAEIQQMVEQHPYGDYGKVSYTRTVGTTIQQYELNWEDYIQRKMRTEINQEIATNMVGYAAELGHIFFICSYYGDCAKDHADYQGKIYAAQDWEEILDETYTGAGLEEMKAQIQDYITSNHIMFVEDVMSDDPFLTTRPNCRHYMQYISIDEVLGITNQKDMQKALDERNMAYNGKYNPEKYEALQKQRYNERHIRDYKAQLSAAEQALANLPKNASNEQKISAQAHVDSLKQSVAAWQKTQRNLFKGLDKNGEKLQGVDPSQLVREYSREKNLFIDLEKQKQRKGPQISITGSGGLKTR